MIHMIWCILWGSFIIGCLSHPQDTSRRIPLAIHWIEDSKIPPLHRWFSLIAPQIVASWAQLTHDQEAQWVVTIKAKQFLNNHQIVQDLARHPFFEGRQAQPHKITITGTILIASPTGEILCETPFTIQRSFENSETFFYESLEWTQKMATRDILKILKATCLSLNERQAPSHTDT